VSACRSCGAPVLWAVTTSGRRIPLDAAPAPDGAIVATGRYVPTDRGATMEVVVDRQASLLDVEARWVPHWATCPHADDWRRR